MTRFSSVLIGGESLLIRCGEMLLDRGHPILAVVSSSPEIIDWAATQGIEVRDCDALGDLSFDWLFSMANLALIPDAILDMPRCGAINFHDGPLPRYAGLNAPVWAILNGETRHGIAWHMIEGGVDEGDIVASRSLPIAADETAFTLNAKCYAAAVEAFRDLVGDLESGAPRRQTQDLTERSYYARDRRPHGAGLIDPRQSPDQMSALVRALDHGTYWNPLCRPKIRIGGRVVLVGQVDPCAGAGTPGRVLETDDAGITIAADGGAVRLSGLTNTFGASLKGQDIALAGQLLDMPSDDVTSALSEFASNTARGDAFWRGQLVAMRPLRLPLLTMHGDTGVLARGLRLPEGLCTARIAGIATAAALRSAGDIGASIAVRMSDTDPVAAGIVSDWAPLRLSGQTLGAALAGFEAAFATAVRHPVYCTDLVARDPRISAPEMPDFGLSLTSNAVPGCPVTLCLTDAGAMLKADTALLSETAFGLMVARIETLAEHVATGTVEDLALDQLPILCEAEMDEVLRVRNQTERTHDASRLLHQHVEARADSAPEATALIFETETLSHAELESWANRIAHVLRGMDVRPGQPVGLHCRRGFDLIAGALGILKAGGAYVPMDPTYPADRLAHYITDSEARVVVTQAALADALPDSAAHTLVIDADPRLATAPDTRPTDGALGTDLAYLIYTSGSTGTPKGVMVEHRNVANCFAGMDAHVTGGPGDTWMAVTSLSFDIAVLELFYALSRGFRVVIGGDPDRMPVAGDAGAVSDRCMEFSLFYWGNDDGPGARKYNLLLEGAKFADENGFCAVWTPERHFHAFGGPYPNPSVTGAAVAAVTQNLAVRAGSCVAPLHHPARIAEEWAVIDNLTNGRAGIGFASGWQPDDFVLRPENTPPANKPALFDTMDKVRRLWRGEEVDFPAVNGTKKAVLSQPRPVSGELPVWVTTAGNPDTWREAGRAGANVLTHLLGQSIDEVEDKIRIYRKALSDAGHNPDAFKVTLMLHTFLADDREEARAISREPMKDYLRSAAGLIKQYAWAFPAFKKPAGTTNPMDIDLGALSSEEMEGILDFAFLRYFEESGLFGTVDDGIARVERLKRIGVDEIACLIDYGIAPDVVLQGLKPLADVLRQTNAPVRDVSLAAQIARHDVTHMQCTPSMARMICMNDTARAALGGLHQILLGGEALPGSLVRDLGAVTDAGILNMYGPTETTIWSTVSRPPVEEDTANIGHPIANTRVYVLDAGGAPAPIGVPGELFIGGAGVTRGYWNRPDLTADRFVRDPVTGNRMYRTGDLVRWRLDGALDFLGRLDHQIKLRGYRIELGEIEARLAALEGIRDAVVIPRQETGDLRLVAYVTGSAPAPDDWRVALGRHLPDFMIPSALVTLDAFPLTPNKKIDRNALPPPVPPAPVSGEGAATASRAEDPVEAQIVETFARLLGQPQIRAEDNFFVMGGHSLLAVQAHRDLQEALGKGRIGITDLFRFPTARGLAAHLDKTAPVTAPSELAAAPPARSDTIEARRALRRMRVKEIG